MEVTMKPKGEGIRAPRAIRDISVNKEDTWEEGIAANWGVGGVQDKINQEIT